MEINKQEQTVSNALTNKANSYVNKHPNRSDNLKDLFTALAKAQAEMGIAGLNSENPYFKSKYANFTEMVRVSRPALTKHGLSVLQPIVDNENGNHVLHTILCHSSGQWIEGRMKITPPKNDIQTLGSYITYLKRYNYSAIIGVCTTNGEDDGEDNSEIVMRQTQDSLKKDDPIEKISKDQLKILERELTQYPDLTEEIITKMKIEKLAELPKNKYYISMKRIKEIKELKGKVENMY